MSATAPNSQHPLNNSHATSGIEFLDPTGAVSGEAISHWTQDWWSFAISSGNTDGGQLEASPSGGQMFLVGGSFGGDVNGAFTVAAGTPLLVPVFNVLLTEFTGTGPNPKLFATGTPAAAYQYESLWRDNVTSLALTITNNATGEVSQPTNLFDDFAKTGWFTLEGDFGSIPKCQSIGYWSIIEGLKPGSYTLNFGGTLKAFADAAHGISQDALSVHVTDQVTVV